MASYWAAVLLAHLKTEESVALCCKLFKIACKKPLPDDLPLCDPSKQSCINPPLFFPPPFPPIPPPKELTCGK